MDPRPSSWSLPLTPGYSADNQRVRGLCTRTEHWSRGMGPGLDLEVVAGHVLPAHLARLVAAVGLAWGTAAGALIAIGLVTYYRALATGPTGVVAPLAATGAVVPVLVDLVRGQLPGVPAMLGVAVVGAGILVTTLATSRDQKEEPAPPCRGALRLRHNRPPGVGGCPPNAILLALLTAMLFGAFFVAVDRGSAVAGDGVLWVTLGI